MSKAWNNNRKNIWRNDLIWNINGKLNWLDKSIKETTGINEKIDSWFQQISSRYSKRKEKKSAEKELNNDKISSFMIKKKQKTQI